jgi:hypothetical protein
MGSEQTELRIAVRVKRKGHPVGRLGAHIKQGMNATFTAFFHEYNKAGLRRVGAASIRP